jgi:probable HAF family extracellular repeat protein
MKDLGTVSSDTCSSALGVNARNQVVGTSGVCHVSNDHAFLWEQGRIFDLNTLVAPPPSGIRVTIAYSINDRGEIAASGTLPNGDVHAVLLIPKR